MKYAQYNPALSPARVIGWYDTGARHYPNLPPAGELLAVSDAQWTARLSNPSGWAVQAGALVPYAPPPVTPTLAQLAMAALAAGLTITSTGTPSLNGTYACDPLTQSHIQAEMLSVSVTGTFADGTSAVQWPDMSGTLHTFSIDEFKAWAIAIGGYIAALAKCVNGASSTLPPATKVIS
jgi:hypothetical protein